MSEDEAVTYTMGGDNVFADLDVPHADEEYLKAQLAHSIRRVITRQGLTQKEAAAILRTRQSRVSEILGGKLAHFSSDRLFRFLRLLSVPITVTLHESNLGDIPGGITVTTV